MSLRVLEPGLCSLIVDSGRPRTRSLGVPVGGPADYAAFALGNALLGNAENAAALEVTLAGPVVRALGHAGMVILGAEVELVRTRGSAIEQLACNRSFTLEADDELHFGGMQDGARAYLCVVGGFETPEILASRCSLTPVQRDDVLACAVSSVRSRALHIAFAWPLVPSMSERLSETRRTVRIIPGPEADWFPMQLGTSAFKVRPESNRMGLRLSGEPLPVPAREMVSQPVAPGALQVTRDGQLILLGVDGQTIGGYPRIGHVIGADFDLMGQLRPGDEVTFQLVTLGEAEQLNREKRKLLKQWCLRIREGTAAV